MKDYASDKDFVRRFRDGALEIARRKMDDVAVHQAEIETVVPLGPRMATGGHFGGFFLWDTVFAVMWARHAAASAARPSASAIAASWSASNAICDEASIHAIWRFQE